MEREEFLAKVEKLSPRGREVLARLATGKTNKEIALMLPRRDSECGEHLSESTVKGYVEEILQVIGVESRTAAAAVFTRFAGW